MAALFGDLGVDYVRPEDQASLVLAATGDALEARDGARIPIVDGIPRFAQDAYAAAFGNQWHRFAQTQVDSFAGNSISRDRLYRLLGGDWSLLEGRCVLEVGAGSGRFTEIVAARAAHVCAIDLSRAIDVAAANTRARFVNLQFAQASATAIPFPDRTFDTVLMIGVIQHTPDPTATLRSCIQKLKPGGHIVVDFYRWRISYLLRIGAHLTRWYLLSRRDDEKWHLVERVFHTFDPLHRILAQNLVGYVILSRLSPIISYYHAPPETPPGVPAPQLTRAQLREWGLLNTHDSLTDRYKHLFTERSVRYLAKTSGLEVVELRYGGNGLEMIARRPDI